MKSVGSKKKPNEAVSPQAPVMERRPDRIAPAQECENGYSIHEKSDGLPAAESASSASLQRVILTDRIVLPAQEGNFSEARYVKLRGTNEEIGRILADIARTDLQVRLSRYSSPVFGKSRKTYIKKMYPILFARMKGVAASYGLDFEDNTYDYSGLPFNVGPSWCSAVYFPPKFTCNGHGLLARNEDFLTCTMGEMLGLPQEEGERAIFSRCFIIETHPDRGYSSLILTAFDLLSGVLDGMNSEGLAVARLTDKSWPPNEHCYYGGNSAGLSYFQVARLVLDTCSTVEEAKEVLINNKIYFPLMGGHYLICDRFGSSFIYEQAPLDMSPQITDNGGEPQIMTNHPVYQGADLGHFQMGMEDHYNSIRRYQTLASVMRGSADKFSRDFIWNMMTLVYADSNQKFWEGKNARSFPMRTVWSLLYDIDDRSVELKFYLHDRPGVDDGRTELLFSRPYTFQLEGDPQQRGS